MENHNEYDEFLVRYLFNEETEKEKAFIENWLNASEDNKLYFNRLKKAWQLTEIKQELDYITDQTNLEKRWKHLERNITEKEARIIPIIEQNQFEVEQGQRQKSGVYKLIVHTAIAASVILVIGLGWKFFFQDKHLTRVARNIERKTDSLTFVVQHEVNTTGKEKRVQLHDGSLIVLADKSEITWKEPFINSRDIYLNGKAYFKVAKNKTRPFTVFSDEISTTALGTEFTVTAFKKSSQIIVRLYEGEVVVKAVNKADRKLKNDVFLLPGQVFIYSNVTTTKVERFKIDDDAASPEKVLNHEVERDDPSVPQNAAGSWYMFNNQPMKEVFDQLAEMYQVQIIYDNKDVDNIYFTGKYNRSVSIEFILNQIGTLNGLTISKKDNAFIISK